MKIWKKAVTVTDIPLHSGRTIKFDEKQIALFHFAENTWYAVQNLCPHDGQMVISRGLIGDFMGEPKVSCPLYKHSFSLQSGESIDEDSSLHLITFPTKMEDNWVYIKLEN